ncbi:MAG: hypothetical protein LBS37_01685, partial [Treponema sp.]|nr:hypothetical protein [Treponema sp.]
MIIAVAGSLGGWMIPPAAVSDTVPPFTAFNIRISPTVVSTVTGCPAALIPGVVPAPLIPIDKVFPLVNCTAPPAVTAKLPIEFVSGPRSTAPPASTSRFFAVITTDVCWFIEPDDLKIKSFTVVKVTLLFIVIFPVSAPISSIEVKIFVNSA